MQRDNIYHSNASEKLEPPCFNASSLSGFLFKKNSLNTLITLVKKQILSLIPQPQFSPEVARLFLDLRRLWFVEMREDHQSQGRNDKHEQIVVEHCR